MRHKFLPAVIFSYLTTGIITWCGYFLFVDKFKQGKFTNSIKTLPVIKQGRLIFCSLILCVLLPSAGHAHRGAIDEIDNCRIRVGNEIIHFTAYTPTLTGSKEYCNSIPRLGPTNLVFDYEGKKLRNLSVEFEVTKEPEGTRVFYQEPQKIKTGNVNGIVDFSKFGASNYLIHVTMVQQDKRLDTHLPFSVGFGEETDLGFLKFLIPVIIMFIVIIIMIMIARKKDKLQ